MRGRRPDGLAYLDNLDASVDTKERLKWIIKVLAGDGRVIEALAKLDVGETRYYQLRDSALQAAAAAIEPRPAGRPSRAAIADAAYVRALEARVRQLERELHEAQVCAEIALVLQPARGGEDHTATLADDMEKKMRPRQVKIRKPR